jgi:hypothetical protein
MYRTLIKNRQISAWKCGTSYFEIMLPTDVSDFNKESANIGMEKRHILF